MTRPCNIDILASYSRFMVSRCSTHMSLFSFTVLNARLWRRKHSYFKVFIKIDVICVTPVEACHKTIKKFKTVPKLECLYVSLIYIYSHLSVFALLFFSLQVVGRELQLLREGSYGHVVPIRDSDDVVPLQSQRLLQIHQFWRDREGRGKK